MSDRSLRQLEQRWEESRSDEDLAALLTERLRLNCVHERQVGLAAFLGAGGALMVLGKEEGPPSLGLGDWLAALTELRAPVTLRAGLVVCGLFEPFAAPVSAEAGAAMQAIRDQLREPSEEHAAACSRANEILEAWVKEIDFAGLGRDPSAAPVPLWANGEGTLAHVAVRAIAWTAWGASKGGRWSSSLGGLSGTFVDVLPTDCHEEVRCLISEALLSWALGSGEVVVPACGALRSRISGSLEGEIAAGKRDPVARELEFQDRVRQAKRAARERLIDSIGYQRRLSEGTLYWGLFEPGFYDCCCVLVEASFDSQKAWVTCVGFGPSLVDYLIDSFSLAVDEEADQPDLPESWTVTVALEGTGLVRLHEGLERVDPESLVDLDPGQVRDGMMVWGVVDASGVQARSFSTWSPWALEGGERHAGFFLALLEAAEGSLRDPKCQELLRGVRHYCPD